MSYPSNRNTRVCSRDSTGGFGTRRGNTSLQCKSQQSKQGLNLELIAIRQTENTHNNDDNDPQLMLSKHAIVPV